MANTIELVKQRILSTAIRGELVEQKEEEGTAKELLSIIFDEKKVQSILNKVSIVKQSSSSNEDDGSAKIPETWEWIKLGDIILLISGRDLESSKYNDANNGIPYYTGASNFSNGNLIVNRWTEHPKVKSEKGDLLITVKGTIGDMSIQSEKEAHIARQIMAIRNKYNMQLKYIKYFLDSQIIELKSKAKSMIPGLSRNDILEYQFPLPPLAEQERIVSKIESLFTIIDKITEKKEDSLKLIDNIRKTALQDAVMGKLVEQADNYEQSAIFNSDTENLFEIPKSWSWVKLGEIAIIKGGKRIPKGSTFSDETTKHAYLRVTDMQKLTIVKSSLKYITSEVYEKIKSYTISKDEVYLTIAGTIGRVGLIPEDLDGMNLTENACKIDPQEHDKKWLMYFLMSDFVQSQFQEGFNQLAQPKLSIRTTSNTIIPLPPLAEQKRIVEKLDKIMAICDQMEEILDGSREETPVAK